MRVFSKNGGSVLDGLGGWVSQPQLQHAHTHTGERQGNAFEEHRCRGQREGAPTPPSTTTTTTTKASFLLQNMNERHVPLFEGVTRRSPLQVILLDYAV